MKKRIKFKKKPEPEYYSEKGILYCRGLPFKVYESSKLAKLAADRWNAKHEAGQIAKQEVKGIYK
jgi:hypothetical protein